MFVEQQNKKSLESQLRKLKKEAAKYAEALKEAQEETAKVQEQAAQKLAEQADVLYLVFIFFFNLFLAIQKET